MDHGTLVRLGRGSPGAPQSTVAEIYCNLTTRLIRPRAMATT